MESGEFAEEAIENGEQLISTYQQILDEYIEMGITREICLEGGTGY